VRPDTEIAIVGGGCAGLSLAAALGLARVPGHVLVLEPRTDYKRDRTWCFWDTDEHPFSAAISHRWSRWQVSDDLQTALQSSQRYSYCHIAGDDFYHAAVCRLEGEPEQELCRGVTVHSVEPHSSGLLAVETSNGRLLARHVFDSRPQRAGTPTLLQRFVGWHVRASSPCFDASVAGLMSFLPSGTVGRTRFIYVLPFSSTEALVEMTYLDDPQLPPPKYERDLNTWLSERTGSWEVLYTECGSLPMQPAGKATTSHLNLHTIGIPAGRLKPSSGYGFLRIQRHSRAIAHALLHGQTVPTRAEPRLYGILDVIFLRALQQPGVDAGGLFLRMFTRTTPDALVRFLSEQSSPAEMAQVALSLPLLPMMRAALA